LISSVSVFQLIPTGRFLLYMLLLPFLNTCFRNCGNFFQIARKRVVVDNVHNKGSNVCIFVGNHIIRGRKLVASSTRTNTCRVMGTVKTTHPYEHSNQSYGTKVFVPQTNIDKY